MKWLTMVLALLVFDSFAFARQWTDNTGQRHIEAEFAYVENGTIHLRLPTGQLKPCKPEYLSPADRLYAKQLEVAGLELVAMSEKVRAPDTKTPRASGRLLLTSVAAGAIQTVQEGGTAAAMTTSEQVDRQSQADYRPVFKRIYCGCCGCDITVHLIRNVGTVAWCYHHYTYLDQLYYANTDPPAYWRYGVVGSPGTYWYIWKTYHPSCDCYPIWRITPGQPPLLFWAHVKFPY